MALKDITATVISNDQLNGSLYLMKLDTGDAASEVLPGQFVHMLLPSMDGHILRRPFSVYEADVFTGQMDILYQVVGFGTDRMTDLVPGQTLKMITPIGNTWTIPDAGAKALLVGAGVGAAPLFMLYKELASRGIEVDVVLGAQNAESLVCMERYGSVCQQAPVCSTDDGSFGHEGFCTDLAIQLMDDAKDEGEGYTYVAVCGPEPVMRIVSKAAMDRSIPCEVSMEKRMACGIGACLSCVVETTEGRKRACVDGPIFDALKVVW